MGARRPGQGQDAQARGSKAFNALNKKYSKDYLDGPQMFKPAPPRRAVANMLNTFPYKNRTEGQSPDVETLDGARIVESFETRGGGMHNCMTGCIVKCSNIVHDADGNYKTSALEFETLTLLGASCAIKTCDDVADLDRLCDEVGLDTIETGAAIAILMDSGGMEWGDSDGAIALLKEIAEGTELGKMIGNGAVATGKRPATSAFRTVGARRFPPGIRGRSRRRASRTAAGPMGADHTAGLIVNPGLPADELAQASQECQLVNAVCDSSGFCQFLQPNLDDIREYYGMLYGIEVTREEIATRAGNACRTNGTSTRPPAGRTRTTVSPTVSSKRASARITR